MTVPIAPQSLLDGEFDRLRAAFCRVIVPLMATPMKPWGSGSRSCAPILSARGRSHASPAFALEAGVRLRLAGSGFSAAKSPLAVFDRAGLLGRPAVLWAGDRQSDGHDDPDPAGLGGHTVPSGALVLEGQRRPFRNKSRW